MKWERDSFPGDDEIDATGTETHVYDAGGMFLAAADCVRLVSLGVVGTCSSRFRS